MDEALHIFDRPLLRRRLQRAAMLGPTPFLLDRVAAEMAERLAVVVRRFPLAVDLGTPDDTLRHALADEAKIGTMLAVSTLVDRLPRLGLAVAADEEMLPFADQSLDLVVSALALQLVNDLPGALVQVRRALKPDGLFLAALLGGETLTELRQAFTDADVETTGGVSPRVAPFADVRALGMLLQRAGFALPVSDVDRVTVRYETPFMLLDDLRRMGATNMLVDRRRVPMRRTTLLRMAHSYKQRFGDADGRVRATFDVVWLTGWAPHPDQQKPLRPGAAVVRLADALGTRELSTGDKPGH